MGLLHSTFFFLFFIFSFQNLTAKNVDSKDSKNQFVTSLKKIFLPEFPDAHNPSIIDTDQGLLLTFRWLPNPLAPWISYIGVVLLNESLQSISKPQLLNTRLGNKSIDSQSEDARVFSYQGNLYVIYNDNDSYTNPSFLQRRDIYIAELSYEEGEFILSKPLKLYHRQKYHTSKWQKNWVPFEWHGALLFGYSLIPHEILYGDLLSGECLPLVVTPFCNTKWEWKWGTLRGGTPALLIDGEYLAFFHSSTIMSSPASNGLPIHHYFMGAYTFSDEPPFDLTKITPSPIIADGFYTQSFLPKRVIFPGGFTVRDNHLLVAYGKDDLEMWIAIIDRKKLKEVMVPVSLLK